MTLVYMNKIAYVYTLGFRGQLTVAVRIIKEHFLSLAPASALPHSLPPGYLPFTALSVQTPRQ